MAEERSKRNSANNTPCRSCGTDERTRVERAARTTGATFQVIVACATCGHAFAALSRN